MKRSIHITEIMENSIHLINEQYNQPLHLNTIARQNYMSPATYSRYFFELTQCSFSDYINKLRVEHAIKDLICTDLPLTQIALEHGFSNSSVFSKIFRNYTKLSPSDFRKTYKLQKDPDRPADVTTSLAISGLRTFELNKPWLYAINAGDARLLIRSDFQQQILQLADELSIRTFRIWSIFAKELFPGGFADLLSPDFNHLDNIFDFFTEHHLTPWINLTKSSDILLYDIQDAPSNPNAYAPALPPGQLDIFYETLFHHWMVRYGSTVVSKWTFECWYNDMDTSPKAIEQFIQNFSTIHALLKKYLPGARIGILCNSVLSMNQEIDQVLSRWPKHLKPDFFSVFCFPYIKENNAPAKLQAQQFTKKCIKTMYDIQKKYHMEDIPIDITQWNMTVSPRNAVNDSCIAACMLLSNIEETLDYNRPILYCYASDICMAQMDTLPMTFGGIGLLTRNALHKPVFFALSFLKQLPRFCLAHGPGYILSTDKAGRYDLLLFNNRPLTELYYHRREYEITTNIVLSELYSGSTHTFHIDIRLMPAYTVYRKKTLRIVPGESDLLGHLKKFGETVELSLEEIQYLKHTVRPEMNVRKITVQNEHLSLSECLEPYEIRYISFSPLD